MKYWVNEVIPQNGIIPHVNQCYPGYRIYIPEVKLLMESTGAIWKSVQLKSGDEIIDISKAEFTTI